METDVVSGELTEDVAGRAAIPGRAGRPSRRWLGAFAILMTLLAAASMAAGLLAKKGHQDSIRLDEAETAAIAAAKDCILATQPVDTADLAASQQHLIDCSTGDFGTQAQWYGAVLEEAYRAVDVRVAVPALHAAVERHEDDGSIVAMVAFRAVISQPDMADRENGYRVRVRMVLENGIYKVAKLDQVAQ